MCVSRFKGNAMVQREKMLEVIIAVLSSCTTVCRHIDEQMNSIVPVVKNSNSDIQKLKHDLNVLISYFISPPPLPPLEPLPPVQPLPLPASDFVPLPLLVPVVPIQDQISIYMLLAGVVCVCCFLCCHTGRPKSILY